jgi:hypothetical protein
VTARRSYTTYRVVKPIAARQFKEFEDAPFTTYCLLIPKLRIWILDLESYINRATPVIVANKEHLDILAQGIGPQLRAAVLHG